MIQRPGLAILVSACALLTMLVIADAPVGVAAVINVDTSVTPWDTLMRSFPGTTTDTLTYAAEAMLDTRSDALAAGQTYHVTLHTTPGTAFRLDPAAGADLEVILYTQNRASSSGGSRPIVAANVGTVTLAGQNVTGSPLNVDLKDEYAGTTREGVSVSGPTTYAGVKTDPTQRALVTDLTFDFTMPADYVSGPGIPYYLYMFDLVGSVTVPHGQTGGPWIAGFAQVPEPAGLALAGVLGGGLAMRRRERERGRASFRGKGCATNPA
jgi:hypothetical protein